jgi:hypothetical protein
VELRNRISAELLVQQAEPIQETVVAVAQDKEQTTVA